MNLAISHNVSGKRLWIPTVIVISHDLEISFCITEWLSVIAVEIVEHQLDSFLGVAVDDVADQDQHYTF